MACPRFLAAVALTATLVATGCGGDDDEATTPTTSTSTSTSTSTTEVPATTTTAPDGRAVRLTQSCTHDDRDVRVVVRYPEGWNVNDGQGIQACTVFDPDPIDVRAGTEFPRDLGVVLRVEPVTLDQVATAGGVTVEDERSLTVDGRTAVRQEVVTTGEGLGPAGQRAVRYVIDAGPERAIIATTFDVEGNDFARSVEVLDAMAAALEIDPRDGRAGG